MSYVFAEKALINFIILLDHHSPASLLFLSHQILSMVIQSTNKKYLLFQSAFHLTIVCSIYSIEYTFRHPFVQLTKAQSAINDS